MRLRETVLTVLVAGAIVILTFVSPALADDDLIATGAKVFNANCAACHMGGGNVVAANKNLKIETLKQYSMDSEAAIITQVLNGKNAMPSFKARLSENQIKAVANFVLAQSEKGWKR